MISNCILAQNYEMLYDIHKDNFNIALMDISADEPVNLRAYLENNWDRIPSFYKCMVDKEHFEEELNQLNELYYVLDDCDDKSNLISFIKTIVSNFADVTDAPILGISFERVTGDLCRNFHCDMNHLRLVYPLLGSGTLWLSDENVRREHLGQGKNELVVIDQKNIFQVPKKTLSVLKGNGHPTGNNRAVVHASPAISNSNEKRILLRIESLF
jgi:hypothetical protein